MTRSYKYAGSPCEDAYYQSCTIINASRKLGLIKYHSYSTPSDHLSRRLEYTRTLTSHTVILQLSGEAHINWKKHKDVVIKAGQMYFLPRGAEIYGYIVGDLRHIEIKIDRQMSNKEIEDLRKMREYENFKAYQFKAMDMVPQMSSYAHSLESYLIKGVNCTHLHEAKLAELLVIFHWYYSITDNALFFYPMATSISQFKNMVLTNYSLTTTIEELVERSNMSRSTFDRKFKENFNTTPHKWIDEQVRQAIISKASEPNVTVKDIMCELEIYNQSQFTNLCKRLCNVTPSKLIKSICCDINL